MTLALARKAPITALEEIARRYPDVPRLLILKTDVQRRGAHYTDEAIANLDDRIHQTTGTHIFGARNRCCCGTAPRSLLRRRRWKRTPMWSTS